MTRTKIISGGVLTLGFAALGITTADAHSIYKTKELVVNDTFNVKAKESENTVTKKKPVDLFAILDGSPSFSEELSILMLLMIWWSWLNHFLRVQRLCLLHIMRIKVTRI